MTIRRKPSTTWVTAIMAASRAMHRSARVPGFARALNSVTGLPVEAGIRLTRHPDVSMIAFTGGESAGTGVYHAAADGLKHLSLELGGKSPNIIFADAKLPDAVNGAISGIFDIGALGPR